MEKSPDPQKRAESKTQLVEQIKRCLHSGDYSRALDVLRGSSVEFAKDADLADLEKLAHDGVTRKAEADRLITESQELFAQQKSGEALQLLRKAYELDKHNALARAILANALVEHAHSIVETDWLEAENLANQALALNPAHPTAKTVHSLVVERKKTSPVDDWVAQASKRQSSGDLFAALAWVAEGLAVHPDDPKLLQIHDAIQRDQGARRRQARRGDLEELQRMELEIDKADAAAKQALAARIQAIAAKHWTDGEILSVANSLLLRLGLAPQDGSTGPQRRKGGTVIFHVPRASAAEESPSDNSQTTSMPQPGDLPPPSPPATTIPSETPPVRATAPGELLDGVVVQEKNTAQAPEPQVSTPQMADISPAEFSAPAARGIASSGLTVQKRRPARSNSKSLIIVVAAIVLVAAIVFFAHKHHDTVGAKTSVPSPPASSAPNTSTSTASTPEISEPKGATPSSAPTEQVQTESAPTVASHGSDGGAGAIDDQPPKVVRPRADGAPAGKTAVDEKNAGENAGAGQGNAKALPNGKLQRQLTRGGQMANQEPKDYVVQVSKNNATFNVQGGAPGTTILLDQAVIGSIQPNGTFSSSNVPPGDHMVELRKDRFKPKQFQKHFVPGGGVTLGGADTALEAAPSEVKITFTPSDARVAIAKAGELPAMVSSGVPLNLAGGTYTLTARTAESFTRTATLEVVAGESKSLDLSLAPDGMSKWEDPGGWRQQKDSFVRSGGDFVLYGVVPTSGTFSFSAMATKGRLLQWVLDYTDAKNYVLFQMDENNFYRSVIRNGEKREQIIVPDKGDKKSFRTLHIRVTPTEIAHQIRHGNSWTVLDRWTQPGSNLSAGRFGFYLPGNDQMELSGFAHYADLNTH